jgi:hypothetical protein
MSEKRSPATALIGLGAYGTSLAGVLGLIAALMTYVHGEVVASGIFLIASALAFGLLTRAVIGD